MQLAPEAAWLLFSCVRDHKMRITDSVGHMLKDIKVGLSLPSWRFRCAFSVGFRGVERAAKAKPRREELGWSWSTLMTNEGNWPLMIWKTLYYKEFEQQRNNLPAYFDCWYKMLFLIFFSTHWGQITCSWQTKCVILLGLPRFNTSLTTATKERSRFSREIFPVSGRIERWI